MRDVVLYATDTMADWEYSYVVAGLAMAEQQAPGRFRLRVLSEEGADVTTLGGLTVRPDGALSEIDLDTLAILVLPGGNTWDQGHDRVLELAEQALADAKPVAAICGATLGAARAGLLDNRDHTSNAPEFLTMSGYGGADRYREQRVVVDRDLITAPGTTPVDFAAEIFRALDLFPPAVIDAWYGLYTTGERRFYDALVGGGE